MIVKQFKEYGIIIFGKEVYNDGNCNLGGLLWVAYGSIGFAVLYHILFSFIIKRKEDK